MKRALAISILCSMCIVSIAQNFTFTWGNHPSLAGRYYKISIKKKDASATITLDESYAKLHKKNKFTAVDCDSLLLFLNSYDFPMKDNNVVERIYKKYCDTKFLDDGKRVIINKDTFNVDDTKRTLLKFDPQQQKYYQEETYCEIFTDGSRYSGEFVTDDSQKKFNVYCAYINDKDYALNRLVYRLVARYFAPGDYKYLDNIIESDKPRCP